MFIVNVQGETNDQKEELCKDIHHVVAAIEKTLSTRKVSIHIKYIETMETFHFKFPT
jgi:hypothetical protein